MVLHEYYFGNLKAGTTDLKAQSGLYKKLEQSFGSYDAWKKHFESAGNPLRGFVRVQADKTGNVLGTKCVYKGGI